MRVMRMRMRMRMICSFCFPAVGFVVIGTARPRPASRAVGGAFGVAGGAGIPQTAVDAGKLRCSIGGFFG